MLLLWRLALDRHVDPKTGRPEMKDILISCTIHYGSSDSLVDIEMTLNCSNTSCQCSCSFGVSVLTSTVPSRSGVLRAPATN